MDLSILTWSFFLVSIEDGQVADILSKDGINAESIRPLDRAAINSSVRKTNRLVTVEEGFPQHGIGAEICASVIEESFGYLDAHVERIVGTVVPMPYAASLERLAVPQIAVKVCPLPLRESTLRTDRLFVPPDPSENMCPSHALIIHDTEKSIDLSNDFHPPILSRLQIAVFLDT
ncbi:hypothetical protein QJS10_CPA03g01930 [Acorus calamus]|uniref:Pyruvate dehydrogenase E1 component subunit beta n=1 Tax=Acorus calamus TaxID=4465 RepID=A0AAV9F472_ACOCL|nr:hypothetical protein QJS10_CPA03g01930 [Acorus calamus]